MAWDYVHPVPPLSIYARLVINKNHPFTVAVILLTSGYDRPALCVYAMPVFWCSDNGM